MARFFVNVNSVYSVDVDDDFWAEHQDNIDAIADQIFSQYFAGDCDLIDDSVVDFMAESETSYAYSF